MSEHLHESACPAPFVNKEEPSSFATDKFSDNWQAMVAAIALVFLSPLLLLIAVAVKCASPGPVFYRGQRVGKDGKIFLINKFRTLRVGSEKKIGARLLNEKDNLYTPIGRFLKKTKLDELPQLWNVVRGDMRFVGPRPVRPIFLEQLSKDIPHYYDRFQVKPGMTGLAQVRGGYLTHPRNKLRYERRYIQNRSILFDVQLVFLTLLKISHRWLTSGMLLLLLFLFVSFIPASFLSSFYFSLAGVRVNVVHGLIIVSGVYLLSRRLPRNRISLYRSPVYLPMALFLLVSLGGAFFSVDPEQALRGAAYYLVTGFVITLGLINSNLSRRFIRQAVGVVAVAAIGISAIGLLNLIVVDYLAFAGEALRGSVPSLSSDSGITATLGSPMALAAYLALATPCLLWRLSHAEGREQRDFWVVGATLTFIGIILTKTPLGLGALAFTVILYMVKYFRPWILTLCIGMICPFLFLSFRYGQFSLAEVFPIPSGSWTDFDTIVPFLFGYGARTLHASWDAVQAVSTWTTQPQSAYAVLLAENGVLGLFAILWTITASLACIYQAHMKAVDEEIRGILWATFCAVLGFLVSMIGFNAFSNLALQVLFWGTIGVGLGVATHFSGRRKDFAVDMKLGQE